MNWDEWFAENSALTPTLTPSVDELLDMAEAALAAGYDGVIWDANSGRIDEFTFSIYITGVFLTESGAFDSPVIRTGVRVLEKIFAVNRGQKMWLRERSLLGSFQLSTESWPFSYADEAVYKGTVWIQGYPPISVSGTVYRGINNGVFHRWP